MEEEIVCIGCKWYQGAECRKRLEMPELDEECYDYEE